MATIMIDDPRLEKWALDGLGNASASLDEDDDSRRLAVHLGLVMLLIEGRITARWDEAGQVFLFYPADSALPKIT